MTPSDPVDRTEPDISRILKEVATFRKNRCFRDSRGAFTVEGVRNFVQAIDHGFAVEHVLYSEKLLIVPIARKLVRRCRRSGVRTTSLSPENFRKMSTAQKASGIAAVVRQRWSTLNQASPNQGLFWIMLETVQSPGNLGTLIRSSNAAGGAGFVFVGNSVDPYSPCVVRSAMGATFQQKFVRANWRTLRRWIDEHSCEVIGASPSSTTSIHGINYPTNAPLLVFGEERKGLNEQQKSLCNHLVRIPMQEGTDSLNLGVAGSLLMYEVYRRQSAAG